MPAVYRRLPVVDGERLKRGHPEFAEGVCPKCRERRIMSELEYPNGEHRFMHNRNERGVPWPRMLSRIPLKTGFTPKEQCAEVLVFSARFGAHSRNISRRKGGLPRQDSHL